MRLSEWEKSKDCFEGAKREKWHNENVTDGISLAIYTFFFVLFFVSAEKKGQRKYTKMGIKLYICPLKERMKRVKKKNWIVSSFHESFSGFAGKESKYTHEAEEKDSFCVCVCKCI